MSNLIKELKRRNVFRVGIAYAVVAWLLVQMGDIAADNLAFPDWFVPMLMVVLGLGFPIALLLSWAYEMTPSGVKKTAEVDADASISHNTGQKLNYFIIAALVMALGFIAWQTVDKTPETLIISEISDPVIAVLPFVNMSSDLEQEYFSDGISEEILNVLARTDGLQVVSRTSSFQFKGTDLDIIAIAASLNANIILEGSVRKGGDRVRITAQLIDATTGLHLWSETYDRKLDDIFAVQDEISQNIATSLLGAVGISSLPENRFAGTTDMTAYNSYLQANALKSTRTKENLRSAIALYEAAVARAPEFADAWAGLAKARWLITNNFGLPNDYESVDEAANRALAIDPENGQAMAVKASMASVQMRFLEGRQLMERAIMAAPTDPDGHFWLGLALVGLLEVDAALKEYEIAMQMDPANSSLFIQLGAHYGMTGEFAKATALIDKVEKGDTPISPVMSSILRPYILFCEGRDEETQALMEALLPDEIDRAAHWMYYTYAARSGDPERIARAGQMLEQRMAEGKLTFSYGFIEWLELGEMEKARAALVRSLEDSLDVSPIHTGITAYTLGLPDYRFQDPRPLAATIPAIVEAYARAGLPVFENVVPYNFSGGSE